MTTFRDMKIGEQIIAALDENGFEEAFPIQQACHTWDFTYRTGR